MRDLRARLIALLRDPARRAALADAALAACVALYTLTFIARQLAAISNPHLVEFDARSQALPAFRYHGTGLFADDLTVDHLAAEALPGWKIIYWIATLFTDPFTFSKILPLLLLLVLLWHAFAFGRRHGGIALGATTVFLIVHCTFFWERLSGGNPRAFGLPLVVAFLRYASEGNTPAAERKTLAVLLLLAAFYPSAFLFCAPAYGVFLLATRDWKRWLRFSLVGVAAVAIGTAALHTDPRIGRVTVPADARELREMRVMMAQRNLKKSATVSLDATHQIYNLPVGPSLAKHGWTPKHSQWVGGILFALLVLLANQRLRALPPILIATALASVVSFKLAELLLFRLYYPDRMLLYSWPPLVMLGLPLIATLALRRLTDRHGAAIAGVLLISYQLLAFGDGLPYHAALEDGTAHDTPTVRFLATQPNELLVAARLTPAAFIQTWARRRMLFSSQTDKAHFYEYALEMDRRITAFYRAYYSRNIKDLQDLHTNFHVDLLVADDDDFRPNALARPFKDMEHTALARELTAATPPGQFALSHPPPEALLFRDGPIFVLDLRKLPAP